MSDGSTAGERAAAGEGTPADPPKAAHRSPAGDGSVRAAFRERLYLPWWHWPLPLVAAGLLAAEVHMGYPGVRSWLPYLITMPLAVAAMVWLSSAKVEVVGGELRAGNAHIPLSQLGQVDICTGEDKRKAMGPELDPDAFVLHRGWVRWVVRVEVTDPADPTPYWVVSTRSPERLAALIAGQG